MLYQAIMYIKTSFNISDLDKFVLSKDVQLLVRLYIFKQIRMQICVPLLVLCRCRIYPELSTKDVKFNVYNNDYSILQSAKFILLHPKCEVIFASKRFNIFPILQQQNEFPTFLLQNRQLLLLFFFVLYIYIDSQLLFCNALYRS